MWYLSEIKDDGLIIRDSNDGKSFRLDYGDVFPWSKNYIKGIETVLGFDGHLMVPISKYLIFLLDYIESIEYNYKSVLGEFLVCTGGIQKYSSNGVLIRLIHSTVSVLDIVMCASYRDGFDAMLELNGGSIACSFGKGTSPVCGLTVKFCGSYKAALSKLVVVYRESPEFQEKLEGRYLK